MKQDMILILDLGSEENPKIAREIRALGVYTEIHPHDISAAELAALPGVKGIILNGGPNRVVDGVEIDAGEAVYNSGLPVWIQVKNRIAYLIGSGEYKAGDQLPTVRSLAVDLDISYNTVNRAYMDLEREGYISTRKGRGTFVAERHAVGAALAADNPVELLADDLIRTCANAGMADDDILALVQARLAQNSLTRA